MVGGFALVARWRKSTKGETEEEERMLRCGVMLTGLDAYIVR